jgi:hypothetical protein
VVRPTAFGFEADCLAKFIHGFIHIAHVLKCHSERSVRKTSRGFQTDSFAIFGERFINTTAVVESGCQANVQARQGWFRAMAWRYSLIA